MRTLSRREGNFRSPHRVGRGAGLVLTRRTWWHWTGLSQSTNEHVGGYVSGTQQSLNTGWLQSAITREMSQSMKEHIGGYVSSTQQPFNTGWLQSAIALNNSTTPPHPHFILATSTVSVPWQQTINSTRWRSPWTPAHKGRLGSAATHPSPAPTLPPCFHQRRDGSFSSHTHSLLSRDKVAAAKGAAYNGDHSTSTRHDILWQTARRKRLGPRPRRKPGSLYY